MSSHLWNLVKKELRELLTPSALISVIVVVILFISMGSFLGGETKEATSAKHIGYVDLTESTGADDYSHIGLEGLRAYYRDVVKVDPHEYVIQLHDVTAVYGTDEFDSQICAAMEKEKVDTALVILEDFDDNLHSTPMKNGDIAVYWDQQGLGIFSSIGLATSETAKAVMNSAISDKILQEKDPAMSDADRAVALQPIPGTNPHATFLKGTIHKDVTPDQIYAAMNQQTMFVPIIIMLIIVMIGSIVISSMGNEKENKTLETLLTLPVNRTTIVAGKLIGSTIAGLIMGAMYMVGMYFYISGVAVTGSGGVTISDLGLSLSFVDWLIVALFMFLSITCALGLCMILGAMAKNYKAAQMYIMPISILAVIPMFVTMFSSIDALPDFAQAFLFAIPFTHPMTVMQNLMFGNTTWLVGGAIYLFAFAAATFYVTVRIYNSDILITGLSLKGRNKKRSEEENEDVIQ